MLALVPGKAWYKWCYKHLPLVSHGAEFIYKMISSCRACSEKVSQFFWGKALKPSTFVFTRKFFLRLLAGVYAMAFLSLWTQIPGLIGDNGILPVSVFLEGVQSTHGSLSWIVVPTLAWISSSTVFLQFLALLGAGIAVLAALGLSLAPMYFLLWVLYLSLFYAGQLFTGFQWDLLLLEVGFLAIFFAPMRFGDKSDPSHLTVWLFRLLVFKLMFSSGIVKLLSGDEVWRTLSALDYHYMTQPIPNSIAWFAHQLPVWFQHISVLIMFGIQLVLPWCIFAPRRLRHAAAYAFLVLELLIAFTGNFAFFNFLTIALILLLFDDQFFARAPKRKPKPSTKTAMRVSQGVAALVIILSVLSIPTSLRIVNSYGLFSVMTTDRPEIIVEGSMDGKVWKEYVFKYKPLDTQDPPPFVAPHQPRLDWQMWFAALGSYQNNPWFVQFMERLLQGEEDVRSLLAEDPFYGKRPVYVRALLYEYEFTTPEERGETGAWWKREQKGVYLPIAELN